MRQLRAEGSSLRKIADHMATHGFVLSQVDVRAILTDAGRSQITIRKVVGHPWIAGTPTLNTLILPHEPITSPS
jgi:hypothetical protein